MKTFKEFLSESKKDSWSRKINKALFWDYVSPKEVKAKIKAMDDERLITIYNSWKGEPQSSKDGSEGALQIKVLIAEIKRRFKLKSEEEVGAFANLELLRKTSKSDITKAETEYNDWTGESDEDIMRIASKKLDKKSGNYYQVLGALIMYNKLKNEV